MNERVKDLLISLSEQLCAKYPQDVRREIAKILTIGGVYETAWYALGFASKGELFELAQPGSSEAELRRALSHCHLSARGAAVAVAYIGGRTAPTSRPYQPGKRQAAVMGPLSPETIAACL